MVIDSNSDAIYGSNEVLSRLGLKTGSSSMTQYQVHSKNHKNCRTVLNNIFIFKILQGFYCNQISTLPDIGFTIGGNDFFMKPPQYMRLVIILNCFFYLPKK